MSDPFPFPHHKLDVYQVALELMVEVKELTEKVPRGHRNLADHMMRAATNTVLLIAEGANRPEARGTSGNALERPGASVARWRQARRR